MDSYNYDYDSPNLMYNETNETDPNYEANQETITKVISPAYYALYIIYCS